MDAMSKERMAHHIRPVSSASQLSIGQVKGQVKASVTGQERGQHFFYETKLVKTNYQYTEDTTFSCTN